MNRADFKLLSQCRLEEAEVLLKSRQFSGAYYLAGYAVECALKARFAKQTKQHDFPPEPNQVREIYSHDLEQLVRKADLQKKFDAEKARDQEFGVNWNIVKDWTARSRYELHSKRMATAMVNAVSDPRHEVLRCIKRLW